MRSLRCGNYVGAVLLVVWLVGILTCQGQAAGPLLFSSPGCGHRTINTPDASGDVGGFVSLALGTDGFPVISYFDSTHGDLKFAKCDDAACSRATVRTLDSGDDVGWWGSIAVGTDGFPIIAYHDHLLFDLKVAKCGDASCTPALVTLRTLDFKGSVGRYTSVKIGRDGFPVISYHDLDNFALRVAKCGDASCTPALMTFSALDAAEAMGVDTSLAIGADGFPIISYFHDGLQDLKVAKCGDAACTPGLVVYRTLDEAGDIGRGNAIAIGIDGFPVISYFDFTNHDLKVAKCGDSGCTPGLADIKTLDSAFDVGYNTSIAIGIDGFPVISYFDRTNGTVKVAKCGDAACNPALVDLWTIADGGDSSIAIGADGFPVLAFHDSGKGFLKVAKCDLWRLFHPSIRRD